MPWTFQMSFKAGDEHKTTTQNKNTHSPTWFLCRQSPGLARGVTRGISLASHVTCTVN